MKTYTLISDSLMHSPGVLKWVRRVYTDDPVAALRIACESWPDLPAGFMFGLLEGDLPISVDDIAGTVTIVTVE